jgi:4-hydroxy-tetrahydrodipicolinate synthase
MSSNGTPDPRAVALRDMLRWQLVAAAATPADRAGRVDPAVLERYLRSLVDDGVQALAVLAHTGRGPYLAPPVRDDVIRRAVDTGVPVIVGTTGTGPDSIRDAERAAEFGARGLLVFAPEGTDPLAHHDALWRAAGLPLLAFDLYTRPYPRTVRAELLDHPGVAGLKVALLHDAIACQAAIAATNDAGRLAVTGEDRMFSPSLLWGAQAALVGLAAAAVPVTAEVLDAYARGDYARFVRLSARLDRLAAATFTEPMEGYVQRMLWIAAAEGRIPDGYAYDLAAGDHGAPLPPLPPEERERVLSALRAALRAG